MPLNMAGGIIEPPRLYLYNAETNQPLYSIQDRDQRSNRITFIKVILNMMVLLKKIQDKGEKYTIRITRLYQ